LLCGATDAVMPFNDENHFITNNLCISFYQKQQEEDEQILSSLESHLSIT
jgi:hypothetical protein